MPGTAAYPRIDRLVARYKLARPVHVTQPRMPSLDDFSSSLEEIWESRWLTNKGTFHRNFERRLREHLGVEHVNLFCNGTVALLVALHALRVNSGEVITTPFTFPATPHVLYWNGIRPVFCDIDPKTFNLDPVRIEELIGPNTQAILPVHVYGTPCDVDAIQRIADRHGLRVIYDAAHAFGTRIAGRNLLSCGDISMLSFHATKPFSTTEGGALVVKSAALKERIDFLKNFGIADEETVIGPGINGKMNEFAAAFGLLGLGQIDRELEDRSRLAGLYREHLQGLEGISFLEELPDVRHRDVYFPIFVDASRFGMDRDRLATLLKRCNIVPRKYFYPLCSHYPCYSQLPSSRPEHLPVAERASRQVLCLPLYGTLDPATVTLICTLIEELHDEATG